MLRAFPGCRCVPRWNDFNVEISSLVDNEIHHLTLVPGWGCARAREKFSYFQNETVGLRIDLVFALPECQTRGIKLNFDVFAKKFRAEGYIITQPDDQKCAVNNRACNARMQFRCGIPFQPHDTKMMQHKFVSSSFSFGFSGSDEWLSNAIIYRGAIGQKTGVRGFYYPRSFRPARTTGNSENLISCFSINFYVSRGSGISPLGRANTRGRMQRPVVSMVK